MTWQVYAGAVSKGFGESDFAQVLSDRATTESVQRLLDENRRQAQHAKSREAQGEYGICEDCGQKISAERLSFLPEATRCVGCQARQEHI
jgi:RNA polymerase-binding transcription factor